MSVYTKPSIKASFSRVDQILNELCRTNVTWIELGVKNHMVLRKVDDGSVFSEMIIVPHTIQFKLNLQSSEY